MGEVQGSTICFNCALQGVWLLVVLVQNALSLHCVLHSIYFPFSLCVYPDGFWMIESVVFPFSVYFFSLLKRLTV